MLISRAGLVKASERLARLREEQHGKAHEAGDLFRTGGDMWHDNPSFYDAVAEREKLREETERLGHLLSDVDLQFIDDQSDNGTICPGYEVEVEYSDGDRFSFVILGSVEQDLAAGVISCETPIAKALLGHKAGDKVNYCGGDNRLISVSVLTAHRWEGLENPDR